MVPVFPHEDTTIIKIRPLMQDYRQVPIAGWAIVPPPHTLAIGLRERKAFPGIASVVVEGCASHHIRVLHHNGLVEIRNVERGHYGGIHRNVIYRYPPRTQGRAYSYISYLINL